MKRGPKSKLGELGVGSKMGIIWILFALIHVQVDKNRNFFKLVLVLTLLRINHLTHMKVLPQFTRS